MMIIRSFELSHDQFTSYMHQYTVWCALSCWCWSSHAAQSAWPWLSVRHWPLYTDRAARAQLWCWWSVAGVDQVVPVGSYAIRAVQRCHLQYHACRLWCTTRECTGANPLPAVRCWPDVIRLVQDCGFTPHAYADDLQVYGHAPPMDSALLVTRMADCLVQVESQMTSNRLRLDPTKTELIWLGSSRRLQDCTTDPMLLPSAATYPTQHVRDLGIVVDSDLTMSAHVGHVTSVCYFQLRQLRLIWRSRTTEAAHTGS